MTTQMPARILDAIADAEGDVVGAAVVILQYSDPSNPYALKEYAIKEYRKMIAETFPDLNMNTPMSNDDMRKDLIATCEFVVKILKS
jgi:hypothetical protein